MPLLYKPRGQRVIKLESGGTTTIPVYGSYQYKEAQQAPYNSAALLGRYQGQPATKAPAAGKKDKPDIKLDMLDNDAKAFGEEWSELNRQLDKGMKSNPNFENTPPGMAILQRKSDMSTVDLVLGKNRKESHRLSKTQMDNNKASGEWFYKGNQGLVEYMDENGNKKVKAIYGQQINEVDENGNKLYKKLTYGDVANRSEISMDNAFIGSDATDITTQIGYGYGIDVVDDQITKILTKGLGMKSDEKTVTIGGQVYGKDVLTQDLHMEGRDSNEFQLQAVYDVLIDNLQEGPAWETLESRAYTVGGATNRAEAVGWIYNHIANQIAHKTNVKTTTKDVKNWDSDAERAMKGEGGANALGVISKYVEETTGGGAPTKSSLEIIDLDEDRVKGDYKAGTVKMDIETWVVKEADAFKDTFKPFNQNTELSKVVDMSRAILPDGTLLSEIPLDGSSFGDLAIPYGGADNVMRMTFIPMQNGKPLDIPADDLAEMNSLLDVQQGYLDDELVKPGSSQAMAIENEMRRIQDEFLDPYTVNKNPATLEKFYIMDVVYNGRGTEAGAPGNDYLNAVSTSLEGDDTEFTRIFNFTNNPDDERYTTKKDGELVYNYNDKVMRHFDERLYNDSPSDYKRTTIMMPVNDAVQLQQIDQKVYVSKNNLTLGMFGLHPQNLPAGITPSTLRQATRTGGSYSTLYSTLNNL
tara:strand:+ start:175 stop:2262 length:2088 start_codon:yes stop_codon:yes gene_type:complete